MAKIEEAELFTILPQQPTGIARLAALAEHADEGHMIEFKTLAVRSILNKSASKRLRWLAYSINPYRGCEFGCKYCYARYTHEFMEPKAPNPEGGELPNGRTNALSFRDPLSFERMIFLKQNAAWLLEQELKKIDPAMEIAIGTATDPYQPVERRARVTRSLLEVFASRRGLRIGIVTKSQLITRDIDLLEKIAEHNQLTLHITITTPNPKLARILEPRAPRPDLRLRTVAKLRKAGLRTGIMCSPLLPGLTDTLEALGTMARRAKAVDASFFVASPLFLKPCSKETYLAFVREHFPALESLYRFRFDG